MQPAPDLALSECVIRDSFLSFGAVGDGVDGFNVDFELGDGGTRKGVGKGEGDEGCAKIYEGRSGEFRILEDGGYRISESRGVKGKREVKIPRSLLEV